jgi:hypothetical protein
VGGQSEPISVFESIMSGPRVQRSGVQRGLRKPRQQNQANERAHKPHRVGACGPALLAPRHTSGRCAAGSLAYGLLRDRQTHGGDHRSSFVHLSVLEDRIHDACFCRIDTDYRHLVGASPAHDLVNDSPVEPLGEGSRCE